MLSAREINNEIRKGKTVTANVPSMGERRIIMSRTDMMGRIAVRIEPKGSFFNVEAASVKVSEGARIND